MHQQGGLIDSTAGGQQELKSNTDGEKPTTEVFHIKPNIKPTMKNQHSTLAMFGMFDDCRHRRQAVELQGPYIKPPGMPAVRLHM